MPFPLTSPTALRLLTSNPAGLSLPNQRIEICKSIQNVGDEGKTDLPENDLKYDGLCGEERPNWKQEN